MRNIVVLTGIILGIIAFGLKGNAAVLHVNDDYNSSTPGWGVTNFSSIQEAIDSASNGDTIIVHEGVYNEHITVNKEVRIVGENRENVIINGSGWGNAIDIGADNVSIENMTVENAYKGINVYYRNNISILSNEIKECSYGIYLYNSNSSKIQYNSIHGSYYRSVALYYSQNSSIQHNKMWDTGYWGIYCYYSPNNTILYNEIENGNSGIYLNSYSGGNDIEGNRISNCTYWGVYVYSSNNIIANNTFYNITGDGDGAISLYYNEGNMVASNSMNDCYYGIFINGGMEHTLLSNSIQDNEKGLYILSSHNVTMRNNTLQNNTYNFGINGWGIYYLTHDIDTSNTINGLPIYYLINQRDVALNDAAFIALISCDNVSILGINISQNERSCIIFGSDNVTIENCIFYDNEKYGIYAVNSNVSIENCSMFNNEYGFYGNGGNFGINGSNAYNNTNGIYIEYASGFLHGNGIYNNTHGLYLDGFHGSISSNSINSNEYGMEIYYSNNISMRNNIFQNNVFNFNVEGWSIQQFIHDIDTSNTINGLPIYYLINQRDVALNGNAGLVALISCDNASILNMNLSNNGRSIIIVNTTNVTIKENEIHDSEEGIFLFYSGNISVENNEIYGCDDGIYSEGTHFINASFNEIYGCHNGMDIEAYSSTFYRNTLFNCTWKGMDIEGRNNTIYKNIIYDCNIGLYLSSPYTSISSNEIYGCDYGISSHYSYNSFVFNNSLYNCSSYGIKFYYSSNSNMSFNMMENCSTGIYTYGYSISIYNNTIWNSSVGINSDSWQSMVLSNRIYNSNYGIEIYSDGNNIFSNFIFNSSRGIFLSYYASDNNITFNEMHDSSYGIYNLGNDNNISSNVMGNCSVGIYSSGDTNQISFNEIYNGDYAMEIYGDAHLIFGNTITNNGYGIYVYASDSNFMDGNTINETDYGIYLQYSDYSTISLNSIFNNEYGIYFYDSYENNILMNDLQKNEFAISLRYSDDNLIYANNIVNNTHGIYLERANENIIFLNNFENLYNVNTTYSSNFWNSTYKINYVYNGSFYNYLGNYWSDYSGNDSNNDGIGDTPYAIDGESDAYPLMEKYTNYSLQHVYNERSGKKYSSIQAAINDAENGDTLHVYSGVYIENVIVNKEVRIIGTEGARVKAAREGYAFVIRADNVSISRLVFEEGNAIKVMADNCSILDNNMEDCNYAIYLYYARNCNIYGNEMTGVEYGVYVYSSNATISNNTIRALYRNIYLYHSNNCTISYNKIEGGNYGISIQYSSNSTVARNIISNETFYGLRLYYSTHCSILANTINNASRGFAVEGSDIQHFQHFICPLNNVDGRPVYYITSNGIIIDASMAPPCCVYVVGARGVEIRDISVEGDIKIIYSNVSLYNVNLIGDWNEDLFVVSSNLSVYNSIFLNCEADAFNTGYNNISFKNSVFDDCNIYLRAYLNVNGSIFTGCDIEMHLINSSITDSYFEDSYIYSYYTSIPSNNTFARNVVKGGSFNARQFSYVYLNSFIGAYIPCYYYDNVIWHTPEPVNSTYMGNYWSDYSGNDSNNDGIGDTPYTICNGYNDTYPLMQSYVAINAPDLIIESMEIIPYPFSSGQHVTINATVKNVGNENVTETFYVTFYRDDHYIGFAYLNGLAINESKIASITWYAQGGDYDIVAYADAYNYIAEFKEGNNKKSMHVSTPMPDLIIQNISFPSAEAGERIWINVSVANIGGGNASLCYVALKSDGSLIAWSSIAVAAGRNEYINFTNVWRAVYGSHKIEAIIDYFDSIEESNESNNVMKKWINVGDDTSPTIYSIYPYNNSILRELNQIKIWATDNYGSGINLTSCFFNITNGSITNISMKWNTIFLNVSVTEGEHVLNAIIKDNEGNSREYKYNFIVDSTPPSIIVYGVEEGIIYSNSVKPYYIIQDKNPYSSYARLNGHVFTNNQTIGEDGSYSLYIYARDRAGNIATLTLNFSIDNPPLPPPWVTLSWNNDTAMLRWAPSSSPDVAGYNIYRNGDKINSFLITHLSFNDSDGSKNDTYAVRAVDFLGHESENASIMPVSITIEKDTLVNHFPNEIGIRISNGGRKVNISNIEIKLISYNGSTVFADNIYGLSLNASEEKLINVTAWVNNARWIELNASIEGDGNIIYRKDIDLLNVNPLEIETQQLMEGYADKVVIRFKNYGNTGITIKRQDVVASMYIDGILYRQFYGKRSVDIGAGEERELETVVYTPMLSKNVSIAVNLSVSYNGYSYIFVAEKSMEIKRQALRAVEIMVKNITKGMNAIINAKFNNMGSVALNAGAEILIKNRNTTIAHATYPYNVRVNPFSTYDFVFNIVVPLNASDFVTIEAIVNASYDDNFIVRESRIVSTIPPPYNANAIVDKSTYNIGENITIRGRAFYNNNSIASNVSVKISIINRGFIRNFYTTTNATGYYEFVFHPVRGEAGRYIVSAVYPLVMAWEPDTTFEILGLYMPEHVKVDITQNQSLNISLQIYNTGERNLTGITMDVNPSYNGVSFTILNYTTSIAPGGRTAMVINVEASATARNATFVINASSTEGGKARCIVDVIVHKSQPLLKAYPYRGYEITRADNSIVVSQKTTLYYIYESMKPGESIFKTFEIRNIGYGDAYNVSIENISIPWIYVSGSKDIGNIARGREKPVTIVISPPANSSGIFDTFINISCLNWDDVLQIPVRIVVTPNETGNVRFFVRNEVGDVVRGIEVTIVNKALPTITFTNRTDKNGTVIFRNIPTGEYEYRIISPVYHTYVNTTNIEAGITREINVTVISSFLHIEWEVLPIKIMDSYVIVHNITYETNVPVPYISVSPKFEYLIVNASYAMEHGYAVYHGQLTLKNENQFLSVFNVTPELSFSSFASDLISIEFGVDVIPEIGPNQSIVVPYTLRIAGHHSPTIDPCKTYTITIHYTAGQVCVNGTWVDIPAGTDTITIKPVCLNMFGDILNLLKDIGLMVSGLEEIKDIVSLPSDIYTIIEMAVNCYNNQMNSCQGATGNCMWDLAKYVSTKIPVIGDVSQILQDLWAVGQSGYKCLFSNSCIQKQNCNPTTPPPPNAVLIGGGGGGGLGGLLWLGAGGAGEWVTTGECYGSPMMTCVRVKFQIKQKLTMERQAFDAMLRLTNTRPDYALENMSIEIIIRDDEGNIANDNFFFRITDLYGMNSIENGTLPVNSTATIHWLIIPKPGAGGVAGEHYTVMAYINYTLHGIEFSAQTWPEDIEVEPMPILHLDYVLPEKIHGDDPATPEKEPVQPFVFGVRVKNVGYGKASNLTIQSAQPTIISETPGAHISLSIIGTLVNGEYAPNSLTVNFGEILPGEASTAAWIMECNVKGRFIEYNATFEHDALLGGRETSLIQNLTTHWLFKDIIDYISDDGMIDFLVDDNRDGVPEKIIDSNGMDMPVRKINASIEWMEGMARIILNKTIGAEWFYIELPFVGDNVTIKRGDGLILDGHNVWIQEGKIHIVDCGPASMYMIMQVVKANNPPVVNFTFSPHHPFENQSVMFASTSYDSDGFITNYTWNFGDGGIAYGRNVSHVYSSHGTYNVTLTIKDNNGSTTSMQKSITVRIRGDANMDGETNLEDLIEIGEHFGKSKGEAGYLEYLDLNNDGVVNILDMILVARYL